MRSACTPAAKYVVRIGGVHDDCVVVVHLSLAQDMVAADPLPVVATVIRAKNPEHLPIAVGQLYVKAIGI